MSFSMAVSNNLKKSDEAFVVIATHTNRIQSMENSQLITLHSCLYSLNDQLVVVIPVNLISARNRDVFLRRQLHVLS